MKCDKTILAQMLQFIYFGKSTDVIPSAFKTEFAEWMKYYEIEIGPIVWDHFKEIKILPNTSNKFKLNYRDFEPIEPLTPVPVEMTAAQRPISISNKSPAISKVKKPATTATVSTAAKQKTPFVLSQLTARPIAKPTNTILKSVALIDPFMAAPHAVAGYTAPVDPSPIAIEVTTTQEPISTSNTSKPPAKKPVAKKRTAKKPSHPPIGQLVDCAIIALKKPSGSSLQAIKTYIAANDNVDAYKLSPFIKRYLKSATASGRLVQTEGKGTSGFFKLSAAALESIFQKKKPTTTTEIR